MDGELLAETPGALAIHIARNAVMYCATGVLRLFGAMDSQPASHRVGARAQALSAQGICCAAAIAQGASPLILPPRR